ncbi:MAG: ATP phosphoribosyltransferase [Eubacterium sp.]|nr:ATP phosphoribosyltransferase [Eubacterium sp.]
MVNVALPKGRLGEQVYGLFEKAGLECPDILSDTRKLFFENKEKGVRFFWVKPSDVAVYVGRGAADLGIAGSDVLLEHQPDVYELLDLGLGVCRMMVAAPKDFRDNDDMTLRVATKFPNIANRYYAGKSRDIDIIELHGSIELAPLLGLSDVIVDIVETGSTLKANGLVPMAEVVKISARLIANKANFKFKTEEIERVTSALSDVL